jgi:hypothetical protein
MKKKKKEGEMAGGFSSQGRYTLAGCALQGFSRLLGAIKSCFKGQSLNFMCT